MYLEKLSGRGIEDVLFSITYRYLNVHNNKRLINKLMFTKEERDMLHVHFCLVKTMTADITIYTPYLYCDVAQPVISKSLRSTPIRYIQTFTKYHNLLYPSLYKIPQSEC